MRIDFRTDKQTVEVEPFGRCECCKKPISKGDSVTIIEQFFGNGSNDFRMVVCDDCTLQTEADEDTF